jgi:alginate O-acetyltransferase complex protein AlgI
MLFNSYLFILGYLPVVFGVYLAVSRVDHLYGIVWLFLASLFFYGWWDPRYLLLLIPSIGFNYLVGRGLSRLEPPGAHRRALLAFGVSCNLILLAFFKYTGFLLDTVNALGGLRLPLPRVILPLGISFFTFTQIAFLVDAYSFKARELNLARYGLFVSYFPHLVAGPVLHHAEMMPQFADARTSRFSAENVAVGLTIFFIGLFKKVIFADGASIYVGPLFDAGVSADLVASWFGVLAYTVQIYFDFSGYSDMAIGLSRLFGVVLPLNFHSPYKAANIIEFWRCWHMTLSRFLRDYLYIPLGGNRRGTVRRHANLMATMLLGGLWHGAGWTFVIWGGLHGIYLVTNHLWHAVRRALGLTGSAGVTGAVVARGVTFLSVVIAWVFFRATSLASAIDILKSMVGLNGLVLPEHLGPLLGPLGRRLAAAGVEFRFASIPDAAGIRWIGALLLIAFVCPNTQQIMRHWRPALVVPASHGLSVIRAAWSPNAAWAVAIATLAAWATLNISERSAFLYFQF